LLAERTISKEKTFDMNKGEMIGFPLHPESVIVAMGWSCKG
jgi:hypothetical protein